MAESRTSFDIGAALGELAQRFPGRVPQAQQLLRFLGKPTDPSPPFLFVYGHEATGKTSVLKHLLKPSPESSPCHTYSSHLTAYVNCTECFTPRLIFETILGQFCSAQPSFSTGGLGPIKCDDIYDFSVQLAGQLRRDATRHTRYIVFDHAERLRDM
ncbi:Origin recognition complex subunit 5, partial [Dimargaris verticillata]